ncbi:small VCP/p97-interacting protein isoform X1 [Mesocricetus auratus]|uniref:Small VCP/p97-interacting protein isoform X1 n=1 Tax=Mesocricetus auratus TaxID=10036 RepID=A0A1U8CIL5_MESAU|nr:small VCP/p97-interacting protein isoform X1 [Mesocricetus auratus]
MKAVTIALRFGYKQAFFSVAEEKRAKLAEAAERRQKEAASRGILDIQSVEAKRKKREQLEKQMEASGPPAGGLRWTVS